MRKEIKHEKKMKEYDCNNKNYINEYNKKRKGKKSDLENQINTLSETIKTAVYVS